MLLQYHKLAPEDSPLLPAVLLAESMLLAWELVAYSLGSLIMLKYQFHFNIKLILAYSLTAYCLDVVARLTIILFEVGFLMVDHNDDDNPAAILKRDVNRIESADDALFLVLVTCSFYRIFFMVLVSSLALYLAIERYFATVWVSTYERKQYKWISVVIVLISVVGGCLGTVIFHYELINTKLLVILGLLLNVFSIFSFIFLYNTNRRNLKYCQTREMMPSYTLSLRFQLNENLKVMKWLKNCIVVVAVVNIILAGFLIVSNDVYLRSHQPAFAKYSHAFLNFAIAVYGQAIIFIALLSDRNFRRFFLKFDIVRATTRPFFGRLFPEDFRNNNRKSLSTNEETNVYFTSLSTQWDDRMRRTSAQEEEEDKEKRKRKRRRRKFVLLRSRRIVPKASSNEDH